MIDGDVGLKGVEDRRQLGGSGGLKTDIVLAVAWPACPAHHALGAQVRGAVVVSPEAVADGDVELPELAVLEVGEVDGHYEPAGRLGFPADLNRRVGSDPLDRGLHHGQRLSEVGIRRDGGACGDVLPQRVTVSLPPEPVVSIIAVPIRMYMYVQRRIREKCKFHETIYGLIPTCYSC